MIKKLFVAVLMLSSCSFVLACGDEVALIHNHPSHNAPSFMSAEEARKEIEEVQCIGHEESCRWWTGYINDKILKEVRMGSASTIVDVTVCHWYVQLYLESALDRNGYRTEIIPGWDKVNNKPDGKTYLSIGW